MESSVIEGFRPKQYSSDIWTTREQLCLTSAVLQAGDKNWSTVSNVIQQATTEKSRPEDWYSMKNCASQYAKLLEQVEVLKKKKERELLPTENSQQYLFEMLRKKRTEELKEIMEKEKSTYNKLIKEIHLLESNQSDNKLHQYKNEMIKEQELEAEKLTRLQAFLKEREEKLKLAAKTQTLKASVPISPKPKAPGTQFPKISGTTPEITESGNVAENKIQTDQDLKEKAQKEEEDIFTTDVPIKLPSTPSLLSNLFADGANARQKKEDHDTSEKDFPLEIKQEKEDEVIKLPEDNFDSVKCDSSFETNLPLDYTSNLTVEMREDEQDVTHEVIKKLEDNNGEACVDNAETEAETEAEAEAEAEVEEEEEDEKEILQLEEMNTDNTQSLQRQQENNIKENDDIEKEPEEKLDEENEEVVHQEESIKEVEEEVVREEDGEGEVEDEEVDKRKGEDKESRRQKWRKKNLPLLNFAKEETKVKSSFMESDHYALIKKDESEKPQEELRKTANADPSSATPAAEFQTEKEAEKKPTAKKEVKDEYEFDDDASRESTDVKDYTYSRSDRRKFSLSENVSSPVISESTPSSPASTNYGDDPEMEKLHRSWKRSIMLIWNDIAAHKNASLFLKPISEDKVPGYHSIVHRPLDLMSIKRNIENGTIRSTLDFQRDVMLMLLNAKMYNTRDHNIYRMADHMLSDAVGTIEEFIQNQMLAKVVETPQKSLRRETRESSAKRVGDDTKGKRDDKEERPLKRKKII